MSTKNITLSIDEESLKQFDEIVKREYSDRSKLLRKWIHKYLEEEIKK